MSLPPFAPFPDAKVRQTLLPEEWGVFLDSWASLAELYLRQKQQPFQAAVLEETSLSSFLVSFFHELADDESILPRALILRKRCFLLLHRIYSQDTIPSSLLTWSILSDASRVFSRSEQFRTLLESLWKRKAPTVEKSLQLAKTSLIRNLDSKRPEEAEKTMNRIVPLLKLSSAASTYMLTGSDFLDSLCAAYPKVPASIQAKLVTIGYLGLLALLDGLKPNYSLLSDHLYSLKSYGQEQQKINVAQKNYVADLVTNTPLLHRIRGTATAPAAARVKSFAASLSAFQQSSIARPRKLARRKIDKGKGKVAEDDYGHEALGDIHVHHMSLVSQVQDLFPDLGSGFVAKLLNEYNDDVEEVTAHLLENSLPPNLVSADRSEQLPMPVASKPHFTPRSTPPPPERRSVFDNDELDRLEVDMSRLHIGRKNQRLTADKILSDRKSAPTKSAILSALAAFDSDDDERDDTYDIEDVGGTVDSAAPGAEEIDADLRDRNEEVLFRTFVSTPELFGRDAETRRGKARAALKTETSMTDEAIEGWGLMISRDTKRLRRMEAKFSAFSGQQTELASTAWRESPAGSDVEAGETSGHGQLSGRSGRGRGRGRGRGGRGGRGNGNVAGPSDDKSTQVSRQRKEASKGSRANHNRRDQRARKLARGGFVG